MALITQKFGDRVLQVTVAPSGPNTVSIAPIPRNMGVQLQELRLRT
ncbi:MAG TPA: hypothetical protein VGN26_07775 [Armatimonadota bacterium]